MASVASVGPLLLRRYVYLETSIRTVELLDNSLLGGKGEVSFTGPALDVSADWWNSEFVTMILVVLEISANPPVLRSSL